MPKQPSIVLVSNRGPVSFVDGKDGWETKRGAGGLSGALDPVARRLGDAAIWVAATNSEVDRRAVAAKEDRNLTQELGYRVRLLSIDPETYARYYEEVSNRMLWFANHCLWDELDVHRFGDRELAAWNEAFEPVNQRFAASIAEVSGRDTLVLFQDYHLATAPGHLRASHPEQAISHFTHSSFCGPDGLERLPRPIPGSVIEGMLGADLIGFHVAPWAHGFMACCQRIGAAVDWDNGVVRHDNRSSWIRTYPIPIDAQDLRARAFEDAATEWTERFRDERPERLIVRADRTEPSKNIIRGFEAFGVLLDDYPEWRNRVRFVACLYPSRATMPEYETYIAGIQESVRKVNDRHPGAIELFLQDDFDRTLGALRDYDVLLVNPIMDGMNLVSKEGPAINERDGVLVLSSGAGSFSELGDLAVPIEDSLDVRATARALKTALELPSDERTRRMTELKKLVSEHKPEDWIQAQIDDLEAVRDRGAPRSDPPARQR